MIAFTSNTVNPPLIVYGLPLTPSYALLHACYLLLVALFPFQCCFFFLESVCTFESVLSGRSVSLAKSVCCTNFMSF